jgi:hypothetical protein
MYGTEGNMTNGQSGKGNGFADRCVKAYDQLVLGKESNMVVGTLRTGAVISVFVILSRSSASSWSRRIAGEVMFPANVTVRDTCQRAM